MTFLFEIYQTDKKGLAFMNSKWFEKEKKKIFPLYNLSLDFDLYDPFFGYICVFSKTVNLPAKMYKDILLELVFYINSGEFRDFYSRPITVSDVLRLNDKLYFFDPHDFVPLSSKSLI